MIKELLINFKKNFSKIYISSKFLFIIAFFSFLMISISIFIPNLTAMDNVVTIRTVFSSIIGWILESTSREMLCNDKSLLLRNYVIGLLALSILMLLGLSIYFSINVNNPSLILLKNTLFSAVGFLISSSKNCE